MVNGMEWRQKTPCLRSSEPARNIKIIVMDPTTKPYTAINGTHGTYCNTSEMGHARMRVADTLALRHDAGMPR